jgi:hypothetical protein
MALDKGKFEQEFKKMDLAEQATFLVLGAIDTVFHTLTNTFQAIADTSYGFADFTRPGASEKLGAKSLDAILGLNVRTDKVVRPNDASQTEKKSRSNSGQTCTKSCKIGSQPNGEGT